VAKLTVRVHPKSSRAEALVDGEGRIRVYVNEPPEDGKANAAMVKVLAKALGVPKSAVEIVRGTTSRSKVVSVDGVSLEDAVGKLGVRRPG